MELTPSVVVFFVLGYGERKVLARRLSTSNLMKTSEMLVPRLYTSVRSGIDGGARRGLTLPRPKVMAASCVNRMQLGNLGALG